jgi:hypothetical protein
MRADELTDLWTKYISNPVLSDAPNEIQFGQLWAKPGGGWYFFGAYVPEGGHASICRWQSTDLITWTNKTEVLASVAGAWDEDLQVATVFQKPDTTWVMLYRGYKSGASFYIGKATSVDGTTFTRIDNGGVDDGKFLQFGYNYDPVGVILVDSTYYVYVNGYPSHDHTSVYTSTDFVTFTAYAGNPVFKNSFCPHVFKYGSYFYMLINRDLGAVGSVLGEHGIALYRCSDPIFDPADREYLGYVIINDRSYDKNYLDTPSAPFTEITRTTYAAEFGTTLYMLYTGNRNSGVTQALAYTSFVGLAARNVIEESETEI